MKKITKKTKFSELLEKYPEAAEILLEKGFRCLGCAMASFETLEDGARAHGMGDKEIGELVEELNEKLGIKS